MKYLKRIMKKLDDMPELKRNSNDEPIVWSEVFSILWNGRKTLVGGTALIMILGVSSTMYFSKYRSDGFLQFGGPIPLIVKTDMDAKSKEPANGISLADYKRYAAAYTTGSRFNDFVVQNKLQGDPVLSELRKAFFSRDGIGKIIEPVYPFTKIDAKELMEPPKDSDNNVIGLRINFEARNPADAQAMVAFLGRYAMDSIVYLIYSDALRFKHAEITTRITRLDNQIIDLKDKLESYQRKGGALKQIVSHYPDAVNQGNRQVVTITEENSRYLSPVTHLMSTELEALSANESIIKFQREKKQNLLMREYYDKAKVLIDNNKSGETVLRALEEIKEGVFKSKDLNDELVKEVYNQITIDNQSAMNVYLEKSRFIAGPSLPEHPSTRLSTALMMSFLGGVLLSGLLVLARQWVTTKSKKPAE